MLPILIKLGPLNIYTYGALVALGFLIGVNWSAREAKHHGLDPEAVKDLCFYLIVGALVGARLWFVGLAWDHYSQHPLDILKLWEGGLVFYGGLILDLFLALIYVRYRRMSLGETFDVLAPGIALGQAVGRMGCLAAGCCYGRPTKLPWGITFSNDQCLAPLHVALHPTQIYISLSLLVIFFLLVGLSRQRRFTGQIFWTYGLLHGLNRTFLETYRGDFRGPLVGWGLTSTQAASLCFAGVSLIMLFYLGAAARRKARTKIQGDGRR
jgi:phosphatidylglycerol---prolipoprotein diacylglyceryl transferase